MPKVATQPWAHFFDPAGPWGGVHPSHHILRPKRPTGTTEVPVTPQYPDVKLEEDSKAVNPRDDVGQALGQARVSGASPVEDPEVRFTEMIGVEDRSEVRKRVPSTTAWQLTPSSVMPSWSQSV